MIHDLFPPTRTAALERLSEFAPLAGRAYASNRNFDVAGHPHVSRLSPYLRHRMITEDEVLRGVLAHHSAAAAEKFIQEVYWRTYWKGWLEQRPSIWSSYRLDLQAALNNIQTQSGLRAQWEAACTGNTGIDCFDHWARELAETGYLHNHARMWFASIWVFTLRLPWELGADFFLRHLLDGDPASNTLGWRWVAGLQTIGKTYLARPDNIEKFTNGRFRPQTLAPFAAPLTGMPHPDRIAVPTSHPVPTGKIGLLLTEDDMLPDALIEDFNPTGIAIYDGTSHRSPLTVAPLVERFVQSAIDDMNARIGGVTALKTASDIDAWAASFDAVITPYTTVGATADAIRHIQTPLLHQVRPYDAAAWPYASAGFFKFKAKIPKLLERYDAQMSLF